MARDDALPGRQAEPGAVELGIPVEPLERREATAAYAMSKPAPLRLRARGA